MEYILRVECFIVGERSGGLGVRFFVIVFRVYALGFVIVLVFV